MTRRPQIESMALQTSKLISFTLGFRLRVQKSKIMTSKLTKISEVLVPPLLHLVLISFIYLGGCKLDYTMTLQLVVR